MYLTSETRTGLHGRSRQIALEFGIEGVEAPVEMDGIDTVVDPIVEVHNGIQENHEGVQEETGVTVSDDSIQISPISRINTVYNHLNISTQLRPLAGQGPALTSVINSGGQVSLGTRKPLSCMDSLLFVFADP